MKTQEENHLATDEFEPIDLGSVSEETRGGLQQDVEFASGPNSRI